MAVVKFLIFVCVSQASRADTAMKTLTSVWVILQCASMVHCATTLLAHSCVSVLMDISAATVQWTTSVIPTMTTATAMGIVVSLSVTLTLQTIPAVVCTAGLEIIVNKPRLVNIHLNLI